MSKYDAGPGPSSLSADVMSRERWISQSSSLKASKTRVCHVKSSAHRLERQPHAPPEKLITN